MRTNGMWTTPLLIAVLAAMVGCQGDRPATNAGASAAQQVAVSPLAALVARAKSLELDTPYVAPPGDPLEHRTAGFAKINGDGTFPVPKEAYYMSGAGGQTTPIIPSHDLGVARLGHYKGSMAGATGFRKALALLMDAVPRRAPKP